MSWTTPDYEALKRLVVAQTRTADALERIAKVLEEQTKIGGALNMEGVRRLLGSIIR